MQRWAVGITEAGVHDAGGADEPLAEGNCAAIDGLAAPELLLCELALMDKLQRGLEITEESRDRVAAVQDACNERRDGMAGALEPDRVWIVGRGRERCGVE